MLSIVSGAHPGISDPEMGRNEDSHRPCVGKTQTPVALLKGLFLFLYLFAEFWYRVERGF